MNIEDLLITGGGFIFHLKINYVIYMSFQCLIKRFFMTLVFLNLFINMLSFTKFLLFL
jgi:hypothetical protein